MKINKEQARQNRISALEFLYQMEFQTEKHPQQTTDHLAQAIHKKREDIDILLQKYSKNWKLSRMALMDLNILRLAVYEMVFSQSKESPKIFINEAVELAKLYGSSDSFKFVNGILDAIAKKEGKLYV